MLDKIRISTRIAGGFGLMLVLLLALAAVTFVSSRNLGDVFYQFRGEAEMTVQTTELREGVTQLRLAVADFRVDPGEETTARVERRLAELTALLAPVRTHAANAEETALVDAVAAALDDYNAATAGYLAAASARDTARDGVTDLGITYRRGIGRLNAMLEGREAGDLAYDALRASESFLVTRVRIDRFLDGWPPEEFDTADAPFRATLAALDRVATGSLTGEERTLLREQQSGLAEFRQVAEAARDAELARRDAIGRIVAAEPALNAAIEAIMVKALEDQAMLAEMGDTQVAMTLRTILIIAAVALVLGLAAAFVIGRSVASSAGNMARSIGRMAEGDLDKPVPGTDHATEIGTMARALEVLRAGGLKAREMEAAAEAERQQAAARQTAEAEKQARVVADISAGLERLSDGDLTTPIASPSHDPFPAEYEALRAAYNDGIARLGGTLARIGEVAGSVRAASGEISSASADLSGRAETQAATLEQSAAALTELNESVRATTGRAAAAEQASQQNHRVAEQGRGVVREAVTAMQGIEKSSEQITRIIGVIDDIAFQTNLLALNAGVEAARAGEAGRGFAVVASEVRGLAQRATESAREIKALIQESASQVETGSALVRRTGDSLEEILAQAAQVSALMGEIAAAASEQASGLGEVSTGVTQLDQVTQQNAAVAEETTASAAALMQKAEELTAALAGFRTAGAARLAEATATVADWTETAEAALRPAPALAPVKTANARWTDF